MGTTIYTYGGMEALFNILNGVKMVFAHPFIKSLVTLMTLIGLACATFQGILQNSFMPKLSWIVKYTLITALVLNPKATLNIRDTVYRGPGKSVSGLPVGLVLPASLISSIGYGITSIFDQAFSAVGSLEYSKYGQTFGSALISQARNFKIQDPVFRENMESFIDNCVLNDVIMGVKYNVSDLRDSNNIWELIKGNTSRIKMFNYREGKSGRKLVTCREGAGFIDQYWVNDINKLADRFGDTIFGKFGAKTTSDNNAFLGKTFIANFNAVTNMYGSSNAGSNTLRQLMMINALSDMPMTYGAVRARQHQNETWLITGQLARETLPIMHSVFAALIYASFCLIVGFLVLPNGIRVFTTYLGLLVWIELWPPLFAVLNFMSNLSGKIYGGDLTNITMNNASQIIDHHGTISLVASGLTIVLPMLTYNIVKGGAGQFVHLAGQLMGPSQSAAGALSHEVVTGNRSFDNRSIATSQWHNTSGFKTDLNSAFRFGHQEYQQSDGTMVRETPSGEAIFHAGAGITTSVGSKSMGVSQTNTSQLHQSLGFEKSILDSKQAEYSTMQQSMHRRATDFVARLASGEASGEHYNYGQTSSAGQTLSKTVETAKELHERFGFSWQQASEKALQGGIGAKFGLDTGSNKGSSSDITTEGQGVVSQENKPKGIFNAFKPTPSFGLNVDGSLSGKSTRTNIDEQALSEQQGISTRRGSATNIEDIVRGAKEVQFNTNQNSERSLADSLVGSYEDMKQMRNSISVHEQIVNRYQRSIDNTESRSYSQHEDDYHKEHKFISEQKDQYGFRIGPQKAQKIMEQGGPEYEGYHQEYMSKQIAGLQRMPSYDFDYNKRIDQAGINQKINNDEIEKARDEGKGQMGYGNVDYDAKYKTEALIKQNQPVIMQNKTELTNKGKEMQHQLNETAEDNGFFGKKYKPEKNKDEKFEN